MTPANKLSGYSPPGAWHHISMAIIPYSGLSARLPQRRLVRLDRSSGVFTRGYVGGFQASPITPSSPHLPSSIKVACRAYQIWRRTKELQEQFRLGKQRQNIRKR